MTRKNSIERINKELIYLIVLVLFSIFWFSYVQRYVPGYLTSPDTEDYIITDPLQMTFHRRMPVLQLIILLFYKIAGGEMDMALSMVVKFQSAVSIISILFLYEALKKIVHSKKMAAVFSFIYSVLIAIYGFNEFILTESLAASLMCIMVWLVTQTITDKKIRYGVILSILLFLSVMERPSFVFLYPICGVFFIILFIVEKDRKRFVTHISVFVLSLAALLAFCMNNAKQLGVATITDISNLNQVAICIEAQIWDHPDYQEFADIVRENYINGERTELEVSMMIMDAGSCRESGEYAKACKEYDIKGYLTFLSNETWGTITQDQILLKSSKTIHDRFQKIFYEIIRTLVMPWNYGSLGVLILGELIYILVTLIKNKKLLIMETGISGIIICGFIVSLISLNSAKIQRYMVHIIPCYVFFEAIIVSQIIRWVKNR